MKFDKKNFLHYFSDIQWSYSIAFGMRSGSSALANTLHSFGFGKPAEYFQYPYENNPYCTTDDTDTFSRAVALFQSALHPPFYAVKMTYDHLSRLEDVLRRNCEGFTNYSSLFSNHKWLRLQRNDKIAQAISWHIAEGRGLWHIPKDYKETFNTECGYDFFSILSKLFYIYQNEVTWDEYFNLNNITPYIISYEDLKINSVNVLGGIIEYLGFDKSKYPIDFDNVSGLVNLADQYPSVYQSIRSRFCNDLLKIGRENNYIEFGKPLDNWNVFFQQKLWQM